MGKPMNRVELGGKSQGKGRNGYFQLHSVELMNIPSDPDGQVLHIDFYPTRRQLCWPARLLLSVRTLRNWRSFSERQLKAGLRWQPSSTESWCTNAGIEVRRVSKNRGTPRLEESGYQVSHALVEIVGDTIIASGWMDRAEPCRRWRRVLVDVRWVRDAASITAGPAYRLEIASESSGVGIIMTFLAWSLRRRRTEAEERSRIFRTKRRIQWRNVV
jgi:hypothetical protein